MKLTKNDLYDWYVKIDPKTHKAKLVISGKLPSQLDTERIEEKIIQQKIPISFWGKVKSWFKF